MRMFKNYKQFIAYAKDNPKGLWFKERWYGWGWVPVKWQGWATIAVFVGILILNGVFLERNMPEGGDPSIVDLIIFFGVLTISVSLLFLICYKKGERPHWNWGDPCKK